MTKWQARRSDIHGKRILTRRDALALGAAAATSLYLPGGWIRSASAQTSFDYYIGPNGSDSNPGTQSQPWAISAINTKRSTYAGKVVGLLDGTYGLVTLLGMPDQGTNSRNTFQLGVAAGTDEAHRTIIKSVN